MNNKTREILILGAGYAGLMTTLRLAKKAKQEKIRITLVNAQDTFVERIRLHQLASNQPLERISIPRFLEGTGVQFVQGIVTILDPVRRCVHVKQNGQTWELHYDELVYALGSMVNRKAVPGISEFAYTLDYHSAKKLAEVLPSVARQQGRLVIVGGGTTGIEAATEFAESHPDLRVMMLTGGKLGEMVSEKGRAYLYKKFKQLNIELHEYTPVAEIHRNAILLRNGDQISCDLCLWASGFVANPLAAESGLKVNERGQILIDPAMRAISHPDITVVGDAATPLHNVGAPVRMSCYTAMMMGAHGADTLLAKIQGKTAKPFRLSYVILCISLGRHDGLAQFLNEDDSPKDRILTGRIGGIIKERIVRYTIWMLRVQKKMPRLYYRPGNGKGDTTIKPTTQHVLER